MREEIQLRLNELRRELETGKIELQQLQGRENYLRETILRISGAVQALEELLSERQPIEQSKTEPRRAEPVVNQASKADLTK